MLRARTVYLRTVLNISVQRELEIRDQIKAILSEGEEPLNESLAVGVAAGLIGAVVAITSLVMASIKAVEEGPGAPLFQLGHGGNTTTPPGYRAAYSSRKVEKRYHEDMVNTLADAYANALDLARRFPDAAKFFNQIARELRVIIVLARDHTARDLDQLLKEFYNKMYNVKQWALNRHKQGELFD